MPRPKKSQQFDFPEIQLCEDNLVRVEAVREARRSMPSAAALGSLSQLFALLGDPTRLRIVAALATHELCVCDLAATIGQSESAVSHQLRALKALGLIRARRDGRFVFYALDDEHVELLYRQALHHVEHQSPEGVS